MSESLHLVCPHCAAVNRLPASRVDQAPACGKCHQAVFDGRPVELDDQGLERHRRRNDVPLVVDFWAPWCGPCKVMAPAFAQAAAELEPDFRLAKLDTEAQPGAAQRFGIRSIPTLILFKDGEPLARQAGAMGAADIVRWVRSNAQG